MFKHYALYLFFALCATALGAWFFHFFNANKLAEPSALSTQIFALEFSNSAGEKISLKPFQGNTVVLNFWAPWCAPCVEEMPELSALQTHFAKSAVKFIGLGLDSAANIQIFEKKLPVNYPLLIADTRGLELARILGNTAGGLPFTVVLNRQGEIVWRKMGRVQSDELKAVLEKALQAK
jgi:thiol-disulfide isomerase/thioredoxin